MAAVAHADPKGMYSWWWDSHISPKNSKWLQENLYDMDEKVKQMIKLIEEDADSFARRAEMYYKKRPELMKLVEEFYRAYRALAERYDHATGVIRQAHRTMAEAFPNQVPLVPADEQPTVTSSETEPRTPEMPHPSRAFPDPNELQKDDGRARRGLNFVDAEENNGQNHGRQENRIQGLSESERVAKTEAEILALKRALAKLEGEKEAGLLQYQQSMERLSNLESEVSHTQQTSRGLDERSSKAEAEVQTLKEAIIILQAEREVNLLRYQQCLEKISHMEKQITSALKDARELNERATKAETEADSLKQDLARVEAEKEAALVQHQQFLETLSKLEKRLVQAEGNARRTKEQASKAENELEAMKLEIAKLIAEKEDAALCYQQCLDTISTLEHKLSYGEEEMRRLNRNVVDKAEKLQSSEQKCLSLETSNQNLRYELQSLEQKAGSQSEELNKKQKELGRLWACLQEERLRFMEVETTFQTLRHLHSQSQEELRSLAIELHSKAEIMENVKSSKQALEDEVQRVKEENQTLNEFKLSSSMSIRNLQDEILNLRETIAKLDQEVELQVEQKNALQQEIYCLKEELNDVNKRYETMLDEVGSTGFDSQFFGSSVKKLQNENSKLKETSEADRSEKAVILKRLEIMDKLMEKNVDLENSLSELNIELENVRGKVRVLEETCKSLLAEKYTLAAEKATLFSQLQTTDEKLEKLSQKHKLLENSLFDLNAELEGLRIKSKILEDSCQFLDHENSSLISEKETLVSLFNTTHQTLKGLEKQHSELETKHMELKGEKEAALQKVEELLVSLYSEREETSRILQLNETHWSEKELQIHILQEDKNCQKKEYEEEMDRAVNAQIEIFILHNCVRDMEKKNFSLLFECQRLLEASKISEELIYKWETLAVTLYAELQISTVNETVLEGKVWELADACEDLANGRKCIGIESERLKERVNKLENENGRLRDQLAAYVPAVSALDNCIASLELLTLTLAKSQNNAEQKINNLVKKQYTEGSPQTSREHIIAPDAIPNFQHMQKRINVIEMSVKQMNGSFRSKDKMKEIQELKSGSGRHQGKIHTSQHITSMDEAKDGLTDEQDMRKLMPDIPVAENEVLPKDIMLDQMSECSSYRLSRRETLEVDDQMLELWETADKESSIGLTVGKTLRMAAGPSNYNQRSIKERKIKSPSIESLVEKELGVDKLEISKSRSRRFTGPREEGNKRKVLERLDSDAQKLTNLHIVVQDLMKKVEISKQNPLGKDIEYDTVRRQLEAAGEAITKLFETNRKWVKNLGEGKTSNRATDSDESSGSISRRRASEQARRASEKIGRLQIEVQRLQFLLLKLEDERESRGKTRITDRSPRVLLRDYLYGGMRSRTIHRRKKAPFCGCMQPPTKG